MLKRHQAMLGGIFTLICTLFSFVSPAKADMQALRNSDNAVWASFGGMFNNYKESVKPIPDSQHGWLPSFDVGVSALGATNLYLAVEGSVAFGKDDYNGAYLFSPSTPLHRKTDENITTVDAKFGRGYVVGSSSMLIPYIQLGFRYWNRDLGGGQVEDYHHFEGLGGMMFQYAPTKRLILSAYGSAGATIAPQMKSSGDTFDLGSTPVFHLGGKVGFDVSQRVELFTALDYTHFRYVQSDVLPDGFYEPSSSTNNTTARFGIAYHFR